MSEMQVINGGEKGGPVSQLGGVRGDQNVFSKYKDNVFLDSLTGDYYSYNAEQQKWLP